VLKSPEGCRNLHKVYEVIAPAAPPPWQNLIESSNFQDHRVLSRLCDMGALAKDSPEAKAANDQLMKLWSNPATAKDAEIIMRQLNPDEAIYLLNLMGDPKAQAIVDFCMAGLQSD